VRLCGVPSEREECFREDFFGFEMREVVGGVMEAPSWGSAFPGGGGGHGESEPQFDEQPRCGINFYHEDRQHR
jgi:hypothetical protein